MLQKLFIILTLGLIPSLCFAETDTHFLMVIKDNINLREEPSLNDKIINHAPASLQFIKIGESKDQKWLKVKMFEQKEYQLRHDKEFWVLAEDVHSESLKSSSQIIMDMSVLENGPLNECKRAEMQSINSIGENIYVSPVLNYSVSIRSCSKPFNFCAKVFDPDLKLFDLNINDQIKRKLKTITPFYELHSNIEIKSIVETLKIAKIVMKSPGCYAEGYIGTEVAPIIKRQLEVHNQSYFSSFHIPIKDFFSTRLNGGIQYINVLLILAARFWDNVST
jgi:hypothetical protein